ncbi:MAG: hypothetical protein OEL89_03955 [Candidatus Peregrinibacteria bacterium]|nr:hypothetical protein [Candidatus Peregrinibacteria bacterium]
MKKNFKMVPALVFMAFFIPFVVQAEELDTPEPVLVSETEGVVDEDLQGGVIIEAAEDVGVSCPNKKECLREKMMGEEEYGGMHGKKSSKKCHHGEGAWFVLHKLLCGVLGLLFLGLAAFVAGFGWKKGKTCAKKGKK